MLGRSPSQNYCVLLLNDRSSPGPRLEFVFKFASDGQAEDRNIRKFTQQRTKANFEIVNGADDVSSRFTDIDLVDLLSTNANGIEISTYTYCIPLRYHHHHHHHRNIFFQALHATVDDFSLQIPSFNSRGSMFLTPAPCRRCLCSISSCAIFAVNSDGVTSSHHTFIPQALLVVVTWYEYISPSH